MKNTAFILTMLTSTLALAAGGGHGDGHIPLDKIGWQAANLGILLIGIFFFIRKSTLEAFAARKQSYLDQSQKTLSALKDAEAALAGIKEKLHNLEGGEKKALESAQHEANLLKVSIIKDAEMAAEKLKKDATLAINNELNKAKAEINTAILSSAVATTTKNLSDKTQASASQESAFLKQLEQVKA
ncbi:MAG: ATP synthase F0 subunit B [Pseudobdellovibrio sp.]